MEQQATPLQNSTPSSQTCCKRKAKASTAGSLLVLLVLAVGFINNTSDNKIVDYHNKFAKEAFNSVLLGQWNPLVEMAHQKEFNDKALSDFLSKRMIPTLHNWADKAREMNPPEVAKEFQIAFSADLELGEKAAQKLVTSIKAGNADETSAGVKQLGLIMGKMQTDYGHFKEKLVEKHFEFTD